MAQGALSPWLHTQSGARRRSRRCGRVTLGRWALTGRGGAGLGARPRDLAAALLHAPAVAAVPVALQRGEVPAGIALWHVLVPAGAAPVVLQQTLPPALAHAGGPLRGLWHGEGDSHPRQPPPSGDSGLCRAPCPPLPAGCAPTPRMLPWALTWAPAAWWGGARRRPGAGDLLPRRVHAPAVPGAAVALQGPVPALLVALGHVAVTQGWHLPRVHPLVLAGREALRVPFRRWKAKKERRVRPGKLCQAERARGERAPHHTCTGSRRPRSRAGSGRRRSPGCCSRWRPGDTGSRHTHPRLCGGKTASAGTGTPRQLWRGVPPVPTLPEQWMPSPV